uniref:Uncharacterized protein n=1 Tax=Arundo donax TaxID=35708 RepID=A0A0A9D0B4_ARUDO
MLTSTIASVRLHFLRITSRPMSERTWLLLSNHFPVLTSATPTGTWIPVIAFAVSSK